MSEWQPIKTAPKDGTEFLAFDAQPDAENSGMVTCYISISGNYCSAVLGHILAAEEFLPTHWMPLPEPPK